MRNFFSSFLYHGPNVNIQTSTLEKILKREVNESEYFERICIAPKQKKFFCQCYRKQEEEF